MAVATELTKLDSTFDVDKLTYEIFSILENKFLFGGGGGDVTDPNLHHQQNDKLGARIDAVFVDGKVRILAIDGAGSTDGVLAAASLARLEAFLRAKSGNPDATVADYFDVVAGSGAGGILAAMLFTRGREGRPMFTAGEALAFVVQNGRRLFGTESRSPGILRRMFRLPETNGKKKKILEKVFGEMTLRDTVKSVLIPCYDLSTHAPFLFSRADAVEMDGYDFKIADVCLATSSDPTVGAGAVEMASVDGKTMIAGVDGGIAMSNPTAAAITHVLNNKMEFPTCKGVEDLLVVSLGNGEVDYEFGGPHLAGGKTPVRFVQIAGEGASDMVDQAVSMAFGQCRGSNYVRIQANGIIAGKNWVSQKPTKSQKKSSDILAVTEQMLAQKNVESVLFQGKKVVGSTNLEKLEAFSGELVKEQQRRKTSILPTVVLKQSSNLSPRTSSATTLSSSSSC